MTAPGPQKMWGGRFERGPDASFYEFERSWSFDRRLLPQEIALDRAWARAITATSRFACLTITIAVECSGGLNNLKGRRSVPVFMGKWVHCHAFIYYLSWLLKNESFQGAAAFCGMLLLR